MNRRLSYIVNADWYFQLHWLERAKAAKQSGLDVSVITPVTDAATQKSIEDEGIKVIPWALSRSGRHLFKEIGSITLLRKLLKQEQPDLVHCITVKPNVYAFCLSLFMRLKLVLSVTGLGMLFTSGRSVDRITGWNVKTLYSIASRRHYIFFENNDDLNIIKNSRLSDPRRLKRVMGAGVSSKDYAFQAPMQMRESLELFFAARLLQPKGLDVLVEAVRKLNDEGYPAHLRVAGISDPDSPLSIPEKQIEQWNQLPFFEFLGNRKDVPALIAESHFVCLPSTYGEGIPRILIEATAIGRPLITTDVPGCREICVDGYNGFLAEPSKSEPISSALKKIFHDPSLLIEISANSRRVFDRGYDSESVIKYTLATYKVILEGTLRYTRKGVERCD